MAGSGPRRTEARPPSPLDELLHEPRLPDTRGAEHRHEVARAVGHRRGQGARQPLDLLATPHERRVQLRAGARRRAQRPAARLPERRPASVVRRSRAPAGGWHRRSRISPASPPPPGASRRSPRARWRGDGPERALRDHLAGAHARRGRRLGPRRRPRARRRAPAAAPAARRQPAPRARRRLVKRRHAEHGHEGVAWVRLDRPAVPLENGTHVRQVALADAAARLGVGSLGRRRRVDHAGEQDGHRLAGLVLGRRRRVRSRQRSCAARRPARGATGRAAPGSPGRSARCPEAGGPGRSRWWPATAASPLPTRAPSAGPLGSARGRSSRRRARGPRRCGARSARAARPLPARTAPARRSRSSTVLATASEARRNTVTVESPSPFVFRSRPPWDSAVRAIELVVQLERDRHRPRDRPPTARWSPRCP